MVLQSVQYESFCSCFNSVTLTLRLDLLKKLLLSVLKGTYILCVSKMQTWLSTQTNQTEADHELLRIPKEYENGKCRSRPAHYMHVCR